MYAYKRKFGGICVETDETMVQLRKIQVWSTAQNEGRKSNFKYLYALS